MMDDLVEDRISCCGPDKRFRAFVVDREILGNRLFKSRNARERSTSDPPACDFREETLNAVKPARACRREVELKAGMCSKPAAYGRRLVRSVVVEHKMDEEIFRNLIVDATQEAKKFLVPVSTVACADDLSRCDVQGRKQRCDTVASIIVRLSLGYSRSHRKDRLCPIERLDLGFLIDAQHDGSLGGSHVEPNDVSNFFDKERIGRKLERLGAMRLQSKGLPNAMHRGRRQPCRCGHLAHAPMRRSPGSRGQCFPHNLVDAIVGDLPWWSRAWRVTQTLKAHDPKALAPLADCLFTHANPLCDLIIRKTTVAVQKNASALRQLLRRFRSARPGLQGCALSISHVQNLQRTAHASLYQAALFYSSNL